MAEVATSTYPPPKLNTLYFPTLPPKPPTRATSYTRSIFKAPVTALVGVKVDAVQPDRSKSALPQKHPVTPRCRVRSMTGYTNRWRLPESVEGDLLGSSQAIRAVSLPYNENIMKIITAESPHQSINTDMGKAYKFQLTDVRPKCFTGQSMPTSSMMPQCPSPPYSLMPPPKHIPAPPFIPYVPSRARPASPTAVFKYHSKRASYGSGPDVLLKCLGMNWELHRPFLQKSDILSSLLYEADHPAPKKYYKNRISETLDDFIHRSHIYSNEYQEVSNRLSTINEEEGRRGLDHPGHISATRYAQNMTEIKLDIKDVLISKHTMAVALGNLYHEELDIELSDLVGVAGCAFHLKFRFLEEGCAKIMMKNISPSTVCAFHKAASKYDQPEVAQTCERWLELNLVPLLGTQIQLRDLPMDLLQKILKSSRLFTYNEYSLFKTLAYWLFLQMNPQIQLMPSHSTVLSYFNSLPKVSSLLEREEGQVYAPLFMALRLHGITDSNHVRDVQQMNILPQSWIVGILTQHYHALQAGGDMSLMTNFNAASVRQCFIVDDEPPYHSEIFSLHGFHFEIKAVRQNKRGTYSFYMQRLKPSDPTLSFRQCERQTFSVRPDRSVRYQIQVQVFEDGCHELFTTGLKNQQFGLGDKTSKSEVMIVDNLKRPIYVSFSLLFPPS